MKLFKSITVFLFGLFIFSSCVTQKIIPSFESYLYPDGRKVTIRKVDDLNNRKFEFYFFEAKRLLMLEDYHNAILYFHEAIKIDSTCATCYSELGRLMLNAEDLDQAEDFFFKAVQLDPSNEYFIDVLSNIYIHQQKDTLALRSTHFLVNNFPTNFNYLFRLVITQQKLKLYSQALQTLDKIEKLQGNQDFIAQNRVEIYEDMNKFKKAENVFLDLIHDFPSNSDYKLSLGDFYFRHKKFKDALTAYEQVLQKDSTNGMVYFRMAHFYKVKSETSNFKKYFVEGLNHENVDVEFKLSQIYPYVEDSTFLPFTKKEFYSLVKSLTKIHPYSAELFTFYAYFGEETIGKEASIRALESSLLLNENQLDVWQQFLGKVYSSEDSTKFKEYFPRAIKLFPKDPVLNYFGGLSSFIEKDYENAISFLTIASEQTGLRDAFYADIYSLLGDAYFKMNKYASAYESFDKSLSFDANRAVVLNNYAYYLSVNNHELAKAESMISRVMELEPLNPTYLDTYAWVLFKRGKFLDALFVMDQVMDLEKEPSGVLYEHYGDILYMNDEIDKALEYWIKASEFKDDEVSDQLDKKIKEKKYYE